MSETSPIYQIPYLVGSDGGRTIAEVSEAVALRLDAVLAQTGKPPLDSDFVSLLERLATAETALRELQAQVDGIQIPTGVLQGRPEVKYRIVAAALQRVDATTWAVIENSGHQPTGIKSVQIVGANRVRVTYTFTATKVVSVAVTPDEAFAAPGLRVGGSVGLGYTDLYFYLGSSSSPVDPGALSTAGGNIWFYGVYEVA